MDKDTKMQDEMNRMKRLTVAVLREKLQERGLPTQGKKNELVERLVASTSGANHPDGTDTNCMDTRTGEDEKAEETTERSDVPDARAMKRPHRESTKQGEVHGGSVQGKGKKARTKSAPKTDTVVMEKSDRHVAFDGDAPWMAYASPKDTMGVHDVVLVYTAMLGGGSEMASGAHLQRLEFHGYLEKCLAGILERDTENALHSIPFVCSVMLMLNEKCQQSLPSWEAITGREGLFEKLFTRVLSLLQGDAMTQFETFYSMRFVTNAVQSLEDGVVRSRVMKIFSLSMWMRLEDGRRQIELQSRPELIKKWKHLLKKDAKLRQQDPNASVFALPEATFFPWLVDCVLDILGDPSVDTQRIHIATAGMHLCMVALWQLPTRRFALTYLKRSNFIPKARCSQLLQLEKGKAVLACLSSLSSTMDASIDSLTGEIITSEEAMKTFYEYTQRVQRLFFNHWENLKDVSYLSAQELASPDVMRKYLGRLSDSDMRNLVCNQLKLATTNDFEIYGRKFLDDVFASEMRIQSSTKKAVETMPIYPTEQLITDASLVPEDKADSAPLDLIAAVPKINLQFLSLPDYFERNFTLYLAEAAYDVRQHVVSVIRRLAPYMNDCGQTDFAGWSKLGTSVEEFNMTEVKPPNIGWNFPSHVSAEIVFSTHGMQRRVKEEWDQLREHDLLFLVSFKGDLHTTSMDSTSDLQYIKSCVQSIRGCEIRQICDEEGNKMNTFTDEGEWVEGGEGYKRTVVVDLDPIQYHLDTKAGSTSVYSSFNLIVRRNSKENNFKSVLKSIRDALMGESTSGNILPSWLADTFLGYGDPQDSTFVSFPKKSSYKIDFQDTFISKDHLEASFPRHKIEFIGDARPPFKIEFCSENSLMVASGVQGANQNEELKLIATSGSCYKEGAHLTNDIKFTSVQVSAITRSLQPGLSLIVGPPGSGKTDTAVQILHTLYHNNKKERTLIITHSNQALNDIFQKLSRKDINIGEMLRLGYGENLLETEEEYDKLGRVNAMLERRIHLLSEIQMLSESIGISAQDFTCETSLSFWKMHVLPRWEKYQSQYKFCEKADILVENFPFTKYICSKFKDAQENRCSMADMEKSFAYISGIFDELDGLRPFEVLTSQRDRIRYMLTKQAKIIAMTCTHAAIKRQEFLDLDFSFDNVLMEEAAQVLDIESILPITMQQNKNNTRLKRIIMIGDHNQLPPVVTNPLLKNHCRFEQSLFARLIRLNTPYIELNAQGRSRPSIADLFRWRYANLENLPRTYQNEYASANPGFAFEYQFIDIPDFLGKGESQPMPYFYQNLGEAEYIVLVYQYMRLLGYDAKKISILTTYNGQCELLKDVFRKKCSNHPLFGVPGTISTVDKFQGQQNDYILLSLVRTNHIGHLRDVRRLVVALSRARLGLYVFGRQRLFQHCQELRPAMEQFTSRPPQLALVDGEHAGMEQFRDVTNVPGSSMLVHDIQHMATIIRNMEADWRTKNNM